MPPVSVRKHQNTAHAVKRIHGIIMQPDKVHLPLIIHRSGIPGCAVLVRDKRIGKILRALAEVSRKTVGTRQNAVTEAFFNQAVRQKITDERVLHPAEIDKVGYVIFLGKCDVFVGNMQNDAVVAAQLKLHGFRIHGKYSSLIEEFANRIRGIGIVFR